MIERVITRVETCTECGRPTAGRSRIVISKRGTQIERETFCGEGCRETREQRHRKKGR